MMRGTLWAVAMGLACTVSSVSWACNDNDGDGYGIPGDPDCPSGPEEDCDDFEAGTYPGAPEVCDGEDNDCDGGVPADEMDNDFDGAASCEGDCDDDDAFLNTLDQDNDGYDTCSGDCEDGITSINPGADEVCNGFDDNCDGQLLPEEVDEDLDGFMICDGDCDDSAPNRFPGGVELCDGVDNDCDDMLGAEEYDDDGDGYNECKDGLTENEGDCDDLDSTVFPGGDEVCDDGIDNDCNDLADHQDPTCGGGDDDDDDETDPMSCECDLGTGGPALPVWLAFALLIALRRLVRVA